MMLKIWMKINYIVKFDYFFNLHKYYQTGGIPDKELDHKRHKEGKDIDLQLNKV